MLSKYRKMWKAVPAFASSDCKNLGARVVSLPQALAVPSIQAGSPSGSKSSLIRIKMSGEEILGIILFLYFFILLFHF